MANNEPASADTTTNGFTPIIPSNYVWGAAQDLVYDQFVFGATPKLAGTLVSIGQSHMGQRVGLGTLANPAIASRTALTIGGAASYAPNFYQIYSTASREGFFSIGTAQETTTQIAIVAATRAAELATLGNPLAGVIVGQATKGIIDYGTTHVAPVLGEYIYQFDRRYCLGITIAC